jgi:hypothetical protein
MNDVSRFEIEVALCRFCSELSDDEVHQHIDDATHAFADLSAERKPSNSNQKNHIFLLQEQEWIFDQIISVGYTATHLQI